MKRIFRGKAAMLALLAVIFYLYGGYRTANSFDRYCINGNAPAVKEMTTGYKLISFGGALAMKCAPGTAGLSVKSYVTMYVMWPFIAAPSFLVEVVGYAFFQGGIDDAVNAVKRSIF